MARTANPYANDTEWGFDKQMAPGTGGRGGGGAGNGSDNPAPQAKQCWGGSGGSGCVIIKAQYTVSDSFAATGGTNQPNGIVSGSYTYHVFADDGNFVVSSGSKSIDFLIVAGAAVVRINKVVAVVLVVLYMVHQSYWQRNISCYCWYWW